MKASSALGAAIAVPLAAAAAGLFLFPFETVVAARELALRAGGVKVVDAGGLVAYERDLCAPGEPCRCAALIHGLGDSALTWDKILLGKDGASAPPAGWRLLAVNLPGTDGSRAPADAAGYSVPAQAEALRSALSARCPRWTVVGNSLGGWIAGTLALKWPEGVERLLLVNPAGAEDPTGAAVETARVLENPTVEKMKEFAGRAYHKTRSAPERAWPAIVASIKARPAAATVAALSAADLLDKRGAALASVPVRVLWGESDRAIPRAAGERLWRSIPGARFTPVPECGHLPQQECPAAVSSALYDIGR